MKITRAQLMMVIRQRVEELTSEIEAALKGLGFTGPVGRQVVLTGGGAELKNIADYMQGVLGRAVRVGRPQADHRPARRAQRPGFLDPGRAGAARRVGQRRHPRHRAGPVAQRKPARRHDRPADRGDEGRVLAAAGHATQRQGRGSWRQLASKRQERSARPGLPARRGGVPQLCRPRRDRHRRAADEGRARPVRNEAYGVAFSAFFWIYAPVQLFAGWLCDRFSVYRLMARRHPAVGGEHLADGLRRRLRFAARAAHHARRRRKHLLSRQLEDHRPPRPARAARASPMPPSPPGIALGPAVGTLAGGLILAHWGWRAMFFVFGIVDPALAAAVAARRCARCRRPAIATSGARVPVGALLGEMAAVVDVDRPRARQLLLLFPARLAALVPDQVARLLDRRNDAARDARLRGPGRVRARLRPFLRLVDPLGPLGGRCAGAG